MNSIIRPLIRGFRDSRSEMARFVANADKTNKQIAFAFQSYLWEHPCGLRPTTLPSSQRNGFHENSKGSGLAVTAESRRREGRPRRPRLFEPASRNLVGKIELSGPFLRLEEITVDCSVDSGGWFMRRHPCERRYDPDLGIYRCLCTATT